LHESIIGRTVLAATLLGVPVVIYLMYGPNAPATPFVKLNSNFGLAPTVAIILFCCARYDTQFGQIMGSQPLVALGDASYSIYLLHILVFFAAFGAGQTLPTNAKNAVFVIVRMAIALTIVCILSLGVFRYVENPGRRLLRSLWHRPLLCQGVLAVVVAIPLLMIVNAAAIRAYDPYAATENINILSATYGGNCGAPKGNASARLRRACNGQVTCGYPVAYSVLGDTAPGCGKSFAVEYSCLPQTAVRQVEIGSKDQDASGSIVTMSCAK
jgi:hypothetical protein